MALGAPIADPIIATVITAVILRITLQSWRRARPRSRPPLIARSAPPARSRADRIAGALLGTFVGDALGMPFEGLPAAAIPARLEMVEARLGRGTYTDDTQMMIALAESVIEHGSVREEELAQAFIEACDPARGYSAGTLQVLASWRRGVPVDEAAGRLFGGQGSQGNGAAMRIAPIAARFADAPRELRDQARGSARLTHAHPVAIDAAVVQAAAIATALRGEEILAAARAAAETSVMQRQLALAHRLLSRGLPPERAAAELGNSPLAHESVPTAILAASSQTRFEDAVAFAIRSGGDTDTLGAMTGAVAGARDGASSIPKRWLEALEDGPRGRSHVEGLAQALAAESS